MSKETTMMNDNKIDNVQVESKSGIQPEITDKKILQDLDKNSTSVRQQNIVDKKNTDSSKESMLGKKLTRPNEDIKDNTFVDISHFLEEDRYNENYDARKAFLSKLNMNQNIEGLSGEMEGIKNYFEKVLNNCSFNEYYNGDCIKEDTYTYQFDYNKSNKYFSNIKLSYLVENRLMDAYTRITNITLKPDNATWRPNFTNFVLTNISYDASWGHTLADAPLDELDPNQYCEVKISQNDIRVMNAWHQSQSLISEARQIIQQANWNDFNVPTKVRSAGYDSAPIYNIDIKYKITGSYATPTPQYVQGSTLNKQFLQANEMFKNTRLPESLVCNGLDYKAIQLLFGRTENVGVCYTNKTNLFKLILYLLMFKDESNEYLRNFNSNNLYQTIAEKIEYRNFNNTFKNYFTRDDFSINWVSWDQYYKRKMGLLNIEQDDTNIYYLPCHKSEFENSTYFLLSIISILPYPLCSKHLYMYLIYAYRVGLVDEVRKLSYSGNKHCADYMYNYLNINGFNKICFVIMDLPTGYDDPASQSYYRPGFNIYGVNNIRLINLYINEIIEQGKHVLTLEDVQNILTNNNFINQYFGNFRNYIINFKKWELDGGIFEFAVLLTAVLKCNYQNMTYNSIFDRTFGDESTNIYNVENQTWPFSLNGLMYTNANNTHSKIMSYAYYSNFNSLLCEYTGLIKLQRPRVSLMIETEEELINLIYLIRLKASIGMNDMIKYKRIPTMPDNANLPTSSNVTNSVLNNIYSYVRKRNKIDQNFISIAGKYNNNYIDKESNFYTIYKVNATMSTSLPLLFEDQYDNYIYCTTEKWIKDYFNCDDAADTTIKDSRTLNINKFNNKFINFVKLSNVGDVEPVHYGLYSSIDYYRKEIEREISNSLCEYISNCYSIHFRYNDNDQRNPGIFKLNKILINTRDYYYKYINIPIINITPFTCLTNQTKKFWVFSTNDTDYQLTFSNILYNMFNYLENMMSALILKCDTVAVLMPKFISCRLQNNNQIVTIDAPQQANPKDFIDDDE